MNLYKLKQIVMAFIKKNITKATSLKAENFKVDKNNFSKISLNFISNIFFKEAKKQHAIINEILSLKNEDLSHLTSTERGIPSDPEFQKNDYFKKMLERYFFTGKIFCKNKIILDSCCGIGWGTRIIAHYADRVVAYDTDPNIIDFARSYWRKNNINWVCNDALNRAFHIKNQFDVVLSMESIEHFSKKQGKVYLENLSGTLKSDGFLIGSSGFANSRKEAIKLAERNRHHIYIYTVKEMSKLLRHSFKEHTIINNWIFIARK